MSWRRLLPTALFVVLVGVVPGFSGDKKDDKVPFEVYAKGYFVKNNARCRRTRRSSSCRTRKRSTKSSASPSSWAKPKFVDEKVFDTNMIVTVVKSGNAVTIYEVEKVSRERPD